MVASLLGRATGPLNPSLIKETIVRKEPDFDERDHGFSTFSQLLEAMEKEGLLKRQQSGAGSGTWCRRTANRATERDRISSGSTASG